MADVINLRRVRKGLARKVAEAEAAQNRAKFGQTKAARAACTTAHKRAEALLSGAKRDKPAPEAQ